MLYGKKTSIRYYSRDLLWGQKLYQKLRFVLVEYQGTKSILVSTSLKLEPLAAIIYYLRHHIFRLMAKSPELCITQLIQEKQEQSGIYGDSQDS